MKRSSRCQATVQLRGGSGRAEGWGAIEAVSAEVAPAPDSATALGAVPFDAPLLAGGARGTEAVTLVEAGFACGAHATANRAKPNSIHLSIQAFLLSDAPTVTARRQTTAWGGVG
jgi:hypothetical protein